MNTKGAPIPEQKEDDTEYIYYTKDGHYLGGKESSLKVFLSSQQECDTAQKVKKRSLINKKLLKVKAICNQKIVQKSINYF